MPAALHPAQQRVLEAAGRQGVALELRIFDESTHTAADAARVVGAELSQIVKSLVFVAPGAPRPQAVLALVNGADRVDIGRLEAAIDLPGLRRASAQEATEATGFSIGGIPPFGHRQPLRVVMDPDLGRHEVVWAAAGTPNAVFPISPQELRRLADALVAPITPITPIPPTTPTTPTTPTG